MPRINIDVIHIYKTNFITKELDYEPEMSSIFVNKLNYN